MTNRKRRNKKAVPKEDQIGHQRPTRFVEDKGFTKSWNKLPPGEKAQLAAQLKQFKSEWCNPDVTWNDLNTTWDYKALQGAPKKSGAQQIRLSNHRIALVVVTQENPCVTLLEIFRKKGKKNPKDVERVAERARRVREGVA